MHRLFAFLQILVVVAIIGFGTWQLFLGNFAASISCMPLLLVYYLFLSMRTRRR